MLGFSLPKLILLGLIVAAIWYGFKFFGSGRWAAKVNMRDEKKQKVTPEAVDMVQCGVCNDFVALKGTTFCGSEGCPYPH
jgi:hypothetical protein